MNERGRLGGRFGGTGALQEERSRRFVLMVTRIVGDPAHEAMLSVPFADSETMAPPWTRTVYPWGNTSFGTSICVIDHPGNRPRPEAFLVVNLKWKIFFDRTNPHDSGVPDTTCG